MRFTQEQFERLSQLMADKGVRHEAFELLADLRQSERVAKQEAMRLKKSLRVVQVIYQLRGLRALGAILVHMGGYYAANQC
jgi:hypothetical protein